VIANRVTGQNLPWNVDAALIEQSLQLPRVVLLNDLLALAYGLGVLKDHDVTVLHASPATSGGNCAVLAAGTGLGEAGLLRSADGFVPFPSEGGHSDFAPNNETEAALYLYLREKFGHVSYERVLSGHGVENVYAFLRDTQRFPEPSALRNELMQATDCAAVISQRGLTGEYAICEEALNIFVCVLAAETGNLALRLLATGGVYVGGGIAPKIAKALMHPRFATAFRSKGRMQPLLERIPVYLVTNQRTGLIGAAVYGTKQLSSELEALRA
jgi:glucokinase